MPTTAAPFEHFVPGSTELPAEMAGTWEGMINQENDVGIFSVRLELHVATPGSLSIGTIGLPLSGCSGTVELARVESDHVLVDATLDYDPDHNCISGMVTLTYLGPTQLRYEYPGSAIGTINRL